MHAIVLMSEWTFGLLVDAITHAPCRFSRPAKESTAEALERFRPPLTHALRRDA
jgi:hypothetical protein